MTKLQKIDLLKDYVSREITLIKTFKKVGLLFTDRSVSPLDISYSVEIFALWGVPSEKVLTKKNHKNYDFLADTYTFMIYEDITIDEGIRRIDQYLAGVELEEYSPKKFKKLLADHLKKEQGLFQALKTLGITDSGPLAVLVKDWALTTALIKPKPKANQDLLNQQLYSVIEQNHSPKEFIAKWVA